MYAYYFVIVIENEEQELENPRHLNFMIYLQLIITSQVPSSSPHAAAIAP